MKSFREVELFGSDVSGRLFLHSMPGRYESMPEFVVELEAEEVDCVLCLVSDAEIGEKSPGYLEALADGALGKRVVRLPIADFGVPGDAVAFRRVMGVLAAVLRAGRNVLIHCAAGVGRTGTAAICLLLDLGFGLEEARARAFDAYAEPETAEQGSFILAYARASAAGG